MTSLLLLLTFGLSPEVPVVAADRFEVLDGAWELRLEDDVAHEWTSARLPGNLPLQGVNHDGIVWFRKQFRTSSNLERMAIRIPMSANAFELFVNGTKVGSRGEIGPGGSLVRKDFRNGVFGFSSDLLHAEGLNELSLRFRTFQGNGGVIGPGTMIGSETVVRSEHERRTFNGAMLFALFIFAAFFHLVLFFGSRNERSYVYFAGMSLALGGVTAGINTFGYQFSDNPDFNAYLVFVPLLSLPYLMTAFFAQFYALPKPKIVPMNLAAFAVGFSILLACTAYNPIYFVYERFVLPLSIGLVVVALLVSTWWTIQALRRGHTGAKTVLFGLASYAVTSCLELGWATQLVPFYVDSYIGFALFIASIVVAISIRFSWLQKQVEMGERDALTNCLTRRGFLGRLDSIFGHKDMAQKLASVIMVDVDHFKSINDKYGHSAGDSVLKEIAVQILSSIRQGDVVARWGGEEFLIVLPNQETSKAIEIAERLRHSIQSVTIATDASRKITASCGVATRTPLEDFDALVSRADVALYEAKNAGRNCVKQAEEARIV
jgi:diguanylate cyclase (GGDEF)-like protein